MIRSVLMSALLAAGLAGSTTAETITVCAKGCDYTSINAAIGAASDGDVIQLSAETYLEGSPVDTAGKAIMIRGARGKLDEPLSILDGAGSHGVIRCTNEEGNDTIFENLVVRNGRAGTDGGGMYNYERSNPSVSNCRFENNRAIYSGGAIYNFNSSPVLTDCFFVDNIAAGQFGWGGAITSDGGSPSFTNCTFIGNVGEYGGAIHNIGSHPTIFGCTFIGNSAAHRGGGIYNRTASNPAISNCHFESNQADCGGGLCNHESSSPSLTNCMFLNNSAYSTGGGTYDLSECSPVLTNCTFQNNHGCPGGGAASNDSSPTFETCLFESNTSSCDGGGLMIELGGDLNLKDCIFLSNESYCYGAAICDFGSSTLNLDGCSLIENSCLTKGDPGGGIFCGDGTFTDCSFTGNEAGYGGAVYAEGTTLFANCSFSENIANMAGTGIFMTNDQASLSGCDFSECCQIVPPGFIIDLGGNDYDSWCDDCRADVNCRDNEVNSADLGYMLAAWGTTNPQCDLDGDGFVRAADLGLLLGYWGPCD